MVVCGCIVSISLWFHDLSCWDVASSLRRPLHFFYVSLVHYWDGGANVDGSCDSVFSQYSAPAFHLVWLVKCMQESLLARAVVKHGKPQGFDIADPSYVPNEALANMFT